MAGSLPLAPPYTHPGPFVRVEEREFCDDVYCADADRERKASSKDPDQPDSHDRGNSAPAKRFNQSAGRG